MRPRVQKNIKKASAARRKPTRVPRGTGESPLSDSHLDKVPTLISIRNDEFDRAVMLCLNAHGLEAARQLASWTCAALAKVPANDRIGTVYIQLDEPLGDDKAPFAGNIFLPSDSIMVCVTGSPSLVNAICAGIGSCAGTGARGGRLSHRLNSLPLRMIVQDQDIIIANEAYFSGLQDRLRRARWRVWLLEYNHFGAGWGGPADELLRHLPEKPQRPRAPVPKRRELSRSDRSTQADPKSARSIMARLYARRKVGGEVART